MAYKYFSIDSDIILDFFVEREPFSLEALQLLFSTTLDKKTLNYTLLALIIC
jgi:hypothetical protein